MATFVGATVAASDGTTVTISSTTIAVHASAAVGDVAILVVDWEAVATTFTNPSGWTSRSGPDSTISSQSQVYTKTLVSGDIGSTLTLTFSATTRPTANMLVFRGATETGILVPTVTPDTAAVSTFTLPSQTGATAGSVQVGIFARRRSGPAGTITIPAGYTALTATATAMAAGANTYIRSGYILSSASGTVGGESGSSGTSSVGVDYLLLLLTAQNFSGSWSPSGVGTATWSGAPAVPGSLAVTGVGTATWSGVLGYKGTLAVAGVGTATWSGKPAAVGALAVAGVGTAIFGSNLGAGTLAVTGVGTVTWTGKPAVSGSLARTGVGTVTWSGVLGFSGTLTRSGVGTLTLSGTFTGRVRWWDGAAWQSATVQYWSGSAWVPAVVKVWDGSAWS